MRQLFFAVDPQQLYNWHALSRASMRQLFFSCGSTTTLQLACTLQLRREGGRERAGERGRERGREMEGGTRGRETGGRAGGRAGERGREMEGGR